MNLDYEYDEEDDYDDDIAKHYDDNDDEWQAWTTGQERRG